MAYKAIVFYTIVLELLGITKKFARHTVLDDVNLKVKAGEIHGLVGLNGSGKSTLLNILFGSRTIVETGGFSGSYLLDNKPCNFSHPSQAVQCGVGMVHQEQALIPALSVAGNIQINREPVHNFSFRFLPRTLSPIDTRKMHRLAAKTLQQMGIKGCEEKPVGTLSLNIKQFVEVARELSREDLRLLLLDEPTAVFCSRDVAQLQTSLRELACKGIAILFVSHRVEEIVATCDSVTVLHDGKVSVQLKGSELTAATITGSMIPKGIVKTLKTPRNNTSSPRVSVRNFHVQTIGDELSGVNLDVYPGEIFGLAGLSGSGRNSLGYGIMGLRQSRGVLLMDGKKISIHSPTQMLHAGFFLLPEERHKLGLLLNHSIKDNIAFSSLYVNSKFTTKGKLLDLIFPNSSNISDHARQCVQQFSITCRDIRQKVAELSGGNQQKVCIAHALTLAPSILLVNEPTRGVDVAAKEKILEQIITTSRIHGTSIILSSSELDELRRICDRIGVLYKGKLQTILSPDTDEVVFASAMMGEMRPIE